MSSLFPLQLRLSSSSLSPCLFPSTPPLFSLFKSLSISIYNVPICACESIIRLLLSEKWRTILQYLINPPYSSLIFLLTSTQPAHTCSSLGKSFPGILRVTNIKNMPRTYSGRIIHKKYSLRVPMQPHAKFQLT